MTTADLAYGVFGLKLEDGVIRATWQSTEHAGCMYLVPERRMLQREFGDGRVKAVLDMYQRGYPGRGAGSAARSSRMRPITARQQPVGSRLPPDGQSGGTHATG
ncbi:MAG: hypothetical protein R3B98_06840 [Hyphomonas sp.]